VSILTRLPARQVVFANVPEQTGAYATTEYVSPLRRRKVEGMTVRNLSMMSHHPTSTTSRSLANVSGDPLIVSALSTFVPTKSTRCRAALRGRGSTKWCRRCVFSSTSPWDAKRIAYALRSETLPVVLSPEEVAAFLEAVPNRRDRVALTTADAMGLGASEVVGLRIHIVYDTLPFVAG
jgi:integrase